MGILVACMFKKKDAHVSRKTQWRGKSLEKRKIAFVHVGKTGGTTASMLIAAACFSSKETCQRRDILNEIEVSKQVQHYYHVRRPDSQNYSSFVITVRDPIDRIISWFLYQHPENELIKNSPQAEKLFECYHDIDDLATKGLLPIINNQNLTTYEKECMKLAHDCVEGKSSHFIHAYFNYHFYTKEILQNKMNEIFVVRTEHFWHDLENINYMLGGGEIPRIAPYKHKNGKVPKVTNRSISPDGMNNLCNALLSEIKIYEQLIERAVNIEKKGKVLMQMNVMKKCPGS